MEVKAFSNWQGTWKGGHRAISASGNIVDEAPYTYPSRFKSEPGDCLEQLPAATQAACFNQAMVNNFGMISLTSDGMFTSMDVDLGHDHESRLAIKSPHTDVEVGVPATSEERFAHCTELTRINCAIAKFLCCDITPSTWLPRAIQ
jgi:osmotically inducible protein OsmC